MTYSDFIVAAESVFSKLSELQKEQFRQIEGLYKGWNEKINVISRKDIDRLYLHHILHSLAIAAYIKLVIPEDFNAPLTFLDVGTGGGFPGIPMAIMLPNSHFTLCDSIGKKTTVAANVSQQLRLQNVATINTRAENISQTFNYAVSRAVAPLDELYPLVQGKYDKGLFCLKGGSVQEEIKKAVEKTGLPLEAVHKWEISGLFHNDYFNEKYVIFIKFE